MTAILSAGYVYKRIAARPDWDDIPLHVEDIYSVSGCMSEMFTDYTRHWRHNGFWLFDRPDIMADIAKAEGIDLAPMTLFYYEFVDQQFDEGTRTWVSFRHDEFPTNVALPAKKSLEGFDVATFSQGNWPECSPLSCNGLSKELPVNEHCLFSTLEAATSALENGHFDKSEPGPFRIVAVYSVS